MNDRAAASPRPPAVYPVANRVMSPQPGGQPPPLPSQVAYGGQQQRPGGYQANPSAQGAAPQYASGPPPKDPITLKVMRLCTPSLHAMMPFDMEQQEVGGAVQSVSSAKSFCLNETLMLPHSFGTIYQGETFRAYITIYNHSGMVLRNVGLKIELHCQQSGKKHPILSEEPSNTFAPADSRDFAITQLLTEDCVHNLVCTIMYTDLEGEARQFMKFFKFQVLTALDIVCTPFRVNGVIYVEPQVENTSTHMLFIEDVQLRPAPGFLCEWVTKDRKTGPHDHMDASRYFQPGDKRHFLFRISRDPAAPESLERNPPIIGHFAVGWRSTMGTSGRCAWKPVKLEARAVPLLDIRPKRVDKRVLLEEPFKASFRVTNRSAEPMEGLRFQFCREKPSPTIPGTGNIFIHGPVDMVLPGPLQPLESTEIELELFPIAPGVQRITGLSIHEPATGKVFEMEDPVDVIVAPPGHSEPEPMDTSSMTSQTGGLLAI